jgi:hypothetical protein
LRSEHGVLPGFYRRMAAMQAVDGKEDKFPGKQLAESLAI